MDISKLPKWLLVLLAILLVYLTGLGTFAVVSKGYTLELWPPKMVAPNKETSSAAGIKDTTTNTTETVQNLSGGWKVVYPNKEYPDETVRIQQNGSEFTGELHDSTASVYEIKGKVTSSRHVSYTVRSTNPKSSYFGIGLMRLSQEADSAEGFVVHLDEKTELPKTTRVRILETKP